MADEVEMLIAKLADIDRLRPVGRVLEIMERFGELRDPREIPSIISAFEWATRHHMYISEIEGALVKIGSPAIDTLMEQLRSQDSDNRTMAAQVLGRIGDPTAVDALIMALDDDDERVKANSVIALGELGHPSAVLPLITATQSDSEWVRGRALDALWKCIDQSSTPILIRLLDDPNKKIREVSIVALGRIKCTDAIPGIILLSGADDIFIQNAVILFFKKLGLLAMPSLAEYMGDRRNWLRNNSEVILGNIFQHLGDKIDNAGDIESLKILEKDLKEGAVALRKSGVGKEDVHDAILVIARLMMASASRKNELASKAMENDGLMLADERPKPPNGVDGTKMYRSHARAITG